MNKVIISGRISNDITFKDGDTPTARFNVAINRYGEGADFPHCTAFKKQAEIIRDYCRKGSKVLIEGHIATGSYTKQSGEKVYTTDVIVEKVEFMESKKEDYKAEADTFQAADDSTLPFN